jgi:hypothetical protein
VKLDNAEEGVQGVPMSGFDALNLRNIRPDEHTLEVSGSNGGLAEEGHAADAIPPHLDCGRAAAVLIMNVHPSWEVSQVRSMFEPYGFIQAEVPIDYRGKDLDHVKWHAFPLYTYIVVTLANQRCAERAVLDFNIRKWNDASVAGVHMRVVEISEEIEGNKYDEHKHEKVLLDDAILNPRKMENNFSQWMKEQAPEEHNAGVLRRAAKETRPNFWRDNKLLTLDEKNFYRGHWVWGNQGVTHGGKVDKLFAFEPPVQIIDWESTRSNGHFVLPEYDPSWYFKALQMGDRPLRNRRRHYF